MFGFLRKLFGFEVASASDAGLVRSDNQDCLLVDNAQRVYCVADGMGGGEGGAIASKLVCDAIGRSAGGKDLSGRVCAIDAAIGRANVDIQERAANLGYSGMGTTVAVLAFDIADGNRVAIGHVGDTRVYVRRGHKLLRLTEDHRKSPLSHFLTRAVGVSTDLHVEWKIESVRSGDVWLICCDGVHDMLPDSTINGIMAKGGDAKTIVDRLSDAVRRAGARDNFSMILLKI